MELLKPGAGLGSIPFFQFNSNSNSVIFNSNSNSNSTTHKKFQFQFQFQFQRFQFQFQFQFQRFQIPAISILEMTFGVFFEIDYNYINKVHVYKIIVINTISLICLVKWLQVLELMQMHPKERLHRVILIASRYSTGLKLEN